MNKPFPLPLRLRITDSSEPFQLRFAASAAAVLAIPGVRSDTSSSGLTLTAASEKDLELAALAVRHAFPSAVVGSVEVVYLSDPELLEPYVRILVTSPEDYFGDVVSDLNRRRGMIEAMDKVPLGYRVSAIGPLAELVGYDTSLRALTKGGATFSYELIDYRAQRDPTPPRPRPAARA